MNLEISREELEAVYRLVSVNPEHLTQGEENALVKIERFLGLYEGNDPPVQMELFSC